VGRSIVPLVDDRAYFGRDERDCNLQRYMALLLGAM
jgi:hypothetical protein